MIINNYKQKINI